MHKGDGECSEEQEEWMQGRRELPAQEARVIRCREVKDKAVWLRVVMIDFTENIVHKLCSEN